VMRQAVGSTPFIIGTKLSTTYHRGVRYLETTIDIQSNVTAARVTGYVAGAISSLALALGFVLEGKVSQHLPEQLLGTVCLDHLDLAAAHPLDTSKPLSPLCLTPPIEAQPGNGVHGHSSLDAADGRAAAAAADGETPLQDVLAQGAQSHCPSPMGSAPLQGSGMQGQWSVPSPPSGVSLAPLGASGGALTLESTTRRPSARALGGGA
jgi:hypothetical protein